MKYLVKIFLCLSVCFLTTSCGFKKNAGGNIINEIVLTPGMSITANNMNGKLIIQAGEKFKRSFTWAGGTRSVDMLPRKVRWNGSLGLYFPGRGNHWKEHNDITRAVIDEGILHFASITEVLEYIERYEDRNSLVYNDQGLFVYWDKSPGAGGTLNVQVWQFLVKGIQPHGISGSNNKKIISK